MILPHPGNRTAHCEFQPNTENVQTDIQDSSSTDRALRPLMFRFTYENELIVLQEMRQARTFTTYHIVYSNL